MKSIRTIGRRARTLPWCGLAVLVLLSAAAAPVQAASIVVDHDTGAVLHAEDAVKSWYPASLTKVMTVYLTFRAVGDGRLRLDQALPISRHAAAQHEVRLGLRSGRTITVEQAVKAVIARSANDAAVVLAEAVAKTEAAFARQMTLQARALGMSGTVFRNATGLPNGQQVTTARDMAVLARAVIRDFPGLYDMFAVRSVTYRSKRYGTRNGWVAGYRGADGLKTGFTCASGYNMVASAVRNGRRLIAVVLGGRTSGARNARTTRLMNRAFKGPDAAALRGKTLDTIGGPKHTAALAPAPHILSPGDCRQSKTATPASRPLSGWGVIFGSFHDERTARDAAAQQRDSLRDLAVGGRIALVPRARGGFHGYTALLVGLKPADARLACQALRKRGEYCLSLSPELLQNPNALWR